MALYEVAFLVWFGLWVLTMAAFVTYLIGRGVSRLRYWRRLRVWFFLRRLRSPGSPGRRGTFLP